ncbi:MAG: hypothetical protein H7066_16290 [Cytophagaceae bacterium]|nr:hypothetical protein [Gemmatimonadaceae bacterium]
MFRLSAVALTCVLAAPLAAQAPAGWHERVDRSTSASDPDNTPDVKFVTMGPGFHVTTGPAVTLWKNENTASGAYTLKGRFRLVQPSGHNNYYGLVFGGSGLEGADQAYLYFLVGQNGSYIVKHRAGAATHDVQGRTPHESIVKPDDKGTSTNTLEVRVAADKIDYVINGTVVHSTPKAGMSARTDGTWGMRVNHQLEVHVDQLAVTK